ncbi:unnamed protein product [marine sediment metagenome]|uniref:Uncharacterized protein n=1 Tax=marine sediment metagenome TaxID=412755 RepID=X1HAB7_9ZZZZ
MKESRKYSIDYKIAFKKAIVSTKKNFHLVRYDEKNGIIDCKTGTSIWSWGETILISVKRIEKGKTRVTIDSSPLMQLFDWGKSEDNVSKFFSFFEETGT